MKLSAKIRRALALAGVSSRKIEATERALLPAPKKMPSKMINRIEALRNQGQLAIVAKNTVFTMAGYLARKKNVAIASVALKKSRLAKKDEKTWPVGKLPHAA